VAETKPIHSYKQLISRAVEIAREGRRKTVSVAAAQDVDVIDAVSQAHSDGFLDAILVGDRDRIDCLAGENGIDTTGLKIENEPDVGRAAHAAVKLAADKVADVVVKGFLPTSLVLKTLLDKQYGLRGENTLSHCAVLDIPGYHKLLNFTDGGMVVKPNLDQKYQILENAVMVGRALGLSPVRIAVSAPSDKLSDKVPHTLTDMDNLVPRAIKNLKDIIIQGPLSLAVATSKAVGEKYQNRGEVVGDADIFLVDSIEEGNIIAKSLTQFADAVFAGVIVGARIPVSLVSRTDTVPNKKASLALACVVADHFAASEGEASR
jgi:phosphate butyryltransferase